MKVLAAMSGGVDSSVAAAMLVADGHEVTGVHMKLSEESVESGGRVHGCCTVEAADDARRVAQVLDIPFYVWNLKDAFSRTVIADFLDEYARGRTPNPCVRCNETVKFGALLDRGRSLGFDAVATGHYAVASHEGASPRLFRGADRAKDQSYVLSTVGREGLAFARFPLGTHTKERTREIARSLALRTADKPESYDICFVPDGDAGAFVERRGVPARPGPIMDPEGCEIGEHAGVHRYTVGQRKGLGLATHERRYVLDIDATRNAIVVGPGELLSRRGLVAERVSWLVDDVPADCEVQIRAHGEPIPSRVERPSAVEARVTFLRTERGVAPGQVVAFYDGDHVLGGGTIAAAF